MRTTTQTASARVLGLALVAALLTGTPAAAQLANASTTTLALAGNNTATVREFGAISVNPAGLGMPGSGFSLTVAPVQVRMGLDPVSLGDLYAWQAEPLPDAVKTDWLARVTQAGGEAAIVGADATAFAFTIGNVGLQLSTTAGANVNLPPGFVEAMLYGNAGRTGEATDLSLVGASVESFAMSTAAMSFALPVSPMLAFGLTGKYTYGHAVAFGHSEAGALEADPIRATMDFPLVTTCMDEVGCTQDYVNGGTGFGLDLGAMLDLGTITVGASLQNVISNFAWDEEKLAYRPGTLLLEGGEYQTSYDELPFEDAPDDLKARVRDYTLKPTVRLGAALDVGESLTLTGDVHGRLSEEGIALQPDYSTGVGATLRLGFLHLRAGVTKLAGGMQYGGGAALALGPVDLAVAGGLRKGGLHDVTMGQLGLSFGGY